MNGNAKPTQHASLADWALLIGIALMGGSSFAMIRTAVETVPPAVVTVARLWIGGIFLFLVMKQAGRSFPKFFVKTENTLQISDEWRWIIVIGAIGYVAPFFIFPWAQQFVDSGLAGIYMAFMPIWTVVLAYFFAGEGMGRNKIIGFALGLIGVVTLMGPGALESAASSSFVAQLALLAATLFYATYAVATRRAPAIRPRAFAAGTVLSAAIIATPALFFTDLNMEAWTASSIWSVVVLGLIPTGLVGILLIIVIQRVGAGFMAIANYLTPVFAVIIGAIAFSERLDASALIALAVILAGVAISQRKDKNA